MILIITGKGDLTTDYLIRRLDERRQPFFRFNTEDLVSEFDVSLTIADGRFDFSIFDLRRETELRRSDVSAAYFRKPQLPTVCADDSNAEQLFNRRELLETLRSVWRLIPSTVWLNSPEALWLAGNKVKQLSLASQIGFRIPPTLISSRSCEVLDFVKRFEGNVIAKAVKHGFLESASGINLIFTTSLEPADLALIDADNSAVPAMIQPRLEKECDLRITVVGDSVFPVAILSQENDETSVDWRTWDVCGVDLDHVRFDLPPALRSQCLELNRLLNLQFSCIDMVLTKNGDFYFLEVNPNGQWAWIEDLVKFPIRDSIIDVMTAAIP